ncbi:glutathione S-transferase N-terminal domain-containing protein [Pseudomonas putida]
MLIVHAFATPNSVKVPIALEELGLDYQLQPVNIRQGEQKHEAFVALNANAKVPVLVDPDGPHGQPMVLTESAAILVYLAERHGQLLPTGGFDQLSGNRGGNYSFCRSFTQARVAADRIVLEPAPK